MDDQNHAPRHHFDDADGHLDDFDGHLDGFDGYLDGFDLDDFDDHVDDADDHLDDFDDDHHVHDDNRAPAATRGDVGFAGEWVDVESEQADVFGVGGYGEWGFLDGDGEGL
jgi:hypothetical protein